MDDRESHERWVREVVARNRSLLVAEAYRFCRNAADADDLVQETLVRFVQRVSKPNAPADERGCVLLMLKILTHHFYDQCRRQHVRDRYVEAAPAQNELQDPFDAAEPGLLDVVTDEQLAQARQTLSPKLRDTYDLLASGMKYRDIASRLGVTVGTVSKRIFDARARVREFLLSLLNRE